MKSVVCLVTRAVALVVAGSSAALSAVQPAPPDTEIFLASVAVDGDALKLGPPINISNSAGYDNQPSFTPDGRTILFTSARGAAPAAAGAARAPATDIYAYDLASSKVRQITATPESEYSPTITPDGRHISVVRVEAAGTQRVWRFTVEGRDAAVVLPAIEPVGYHAWIDRRRLALFVLGEPPALHIANTSGKTTVVARGIGRSIQKIPRGGISYVRIDLGPGDARVMTVMELDPETRASRALVQAVPGATEADLAWMPDGTLLMAHEGTLYSWRRGRTSWAAAADLRTLGLRDVTRLAVNAAGNRMAIVAPQSR